jgi:hypothetical protein
MNELTLAAIRKIGKKNFLVLPIISNKVLILGENFIVRNLIFKM